MKTAVTLLRLMKWLVVMHLVTEWISGQLGNIIDFRKKENALGVQYGYRTCVFEH